MNPVGMICVRFHSVEKLDYQKQLGLSLDPEEAIEKHTNQRVTFDCHDFPQDDEYTEEIYLCSQQPQTEAKEVFDFFISRIKPTEFIVVEVALCNEQLDWLQLLYSNAADSDDC